MDKPQGWNEPVQSGITVTISLTVREWGDVVDALRFAESYNPQPPDALDLGWLSRAINEKIEANRKE